MPLDPELEPHFDEAARLNNLDPLLLRAVAAGEGGNDPNATGPVTRSGQRAGGLMQIMPGTAEQYRIADPYDPVQAIYGGARILNDHLTRAEAARAQGSNIVPVDEALRSYFAGPGGGNRGAQTAAYPGYIAQKYLALQNGEEPPPVPPMSGAAKLAAVPRGPMPAPGTVATNVNPPPGTPDTLEPAPDRVAALAALAGQGTAPAPRVQPVSAVPSVTSIPGGTNGIAPPNVPDGQQVAQAAPDPEIMDLINQGRKAFGIAPPQVGGQPVDTGTPTPALPLGTTAARMADIQWAQSESERRGRLRVPVPDWMSKLAEMEPGMPLSPEYQAQTKLAGNLQQIGPHGVENMPGVEDAAKRLKKAEAVGHTLGTPTDTRQGANLGFVTEPGQAPALEYHQAFQSPHLPPASQLEPPPPGSPPGTPPSVVTLQGGAPAIQAAAGAEAAGKASFEPTTITIGGREYPVTHEQFQQITQGLGIPGAAIAAGTPAIPSAPNANGPLAGATPQTPETNVGKVYQTPAQAGQTEALKEEYEKTVVPGFNHAQDSLKALSAIESAMQNYRTGPTATTRLTFQRALQDFAQMVGASPDSELAKGVASGEIIGKEGNGLGFALARTMGARESTQIVEQAIKTNPGLATSPEGNAQLIGLIRQQMQRDVDRRQFYDSWFNTQGNYNNAGTEFNRLHPVEQYVTKALPYHVQTPGEASKLPPGSFFVNPEGKTFSVPIKAPNG